LLTKSTSRVIVHLRNVLFSQIRRLNHEMSLSCLIVQVQLQRLRRRLVSVIIRGGIRWRATVNVGIVLTMNVGLLRIVTHFEFVASVFGLESIPSVVRLFDQRFPVTDIFAAALSCRGVRFITAICWDAIHERISVELSFPQFETVDRRRLGSERDCTILACCLCPNANGAFNPN